MRDFIGGVLVLLSVICFFGAFVGIVNPQLVTPKGKEPMTRGKAFISLAASCILFLIIAACVVGSGAKAPNQASDHDAPTPSGDPSAGAGATSTVATTSPDSGSATPWLKPEDIVKFPKGMIACLKRDDLQAVTELGATGHKTQMLAYFDPSSDGGLRCIMLSPKKRFKILDSEANSPDLPDALIIEVVGAGIASADHGAYALVLDKSMAEVQ